MKKATTLLVRKVGAVLHPADIVSDDYISELPQGTELHMKPWLPRNPRFHRTAMGYLSMVAQNNETFTDLDSLKKWLLLEMGMYEIFIGHDGRQVYRLYDSVAFSEMDEVHFRRFMRRAEYLIGEKLMNWGVDDYVAFKREAGRQIAQYEGEHARASPTSTEDHE
jgi:hypothetical protein